MQKFNIRVELQDNGEPVIIECLVCGIFSKAKWLGMVYVSPWVMWEGKKTRFVVCPDCLKKDKKTLRRDLLRNAGSLEELAETLRHLADDGIDLPSYEEWEGEEKLADEEYVKAYYA